MTTPTIDEAIDALRRLAPERQRELAGYILSLAADAGGPESIDPAHLPYVTEGLEQARRRQFATDQEVEAAYRSFEE
jgi:hypothetical protein